MSTIAERLNTCEKITNPSAETKVPHDLLRSQDMRVEARKEIAKRQNAKTLFQHPIVSDQQKRHRAPRGTAMHVRPSRHLSPTVYHCPIPHSQSHMAFDSDMMATHIFVPDRKATWPSIQMWWQVTSSSPTVRLSPQYH